MRGTRGHDLRGCICRCQPPRLAAIAFLKVPETKSLKLSCAGNTVFITVFAVSLKRHANAQDAVERSEPLLGRKTTFGEAYPFVTELRIEVTASPMGFGRSQSYYFSLANPPGKFCACPNAQCRDGGFDLGFHLHDMASARKTHMEVKGSCVGYEKLGRRDSRRCHYGFRATIDMKFSETVPVVSNVGQSPAQPPQA
jgi:hypothetical protein